jgi:F-type H+-transporting ATPase subunit O
VSGGVEGESRRPPPLPIQLAALAATTPAFASLLKDKSVAKGAKDKQLQVLLADLKVGDVTKTFVSVLTENGRLAELPRVGPAFASLLAASRGQVTAMVTTADPLSKEEEEEIRKGLAEQLPKGRTLKMGTRVDPAIIGGLVVDIGDKHIDLSIASRVKQVQQLLNAGTD